MTPESIRPFPASEKITGPETERSPAAPIFQTPDGAPEYIRCSKRHPRYFEDGAGAPFIPIGLNLCFPRFSTSAADGLATMHRWLDRLAENGGNFARVYLSHPFFEIEQEKMGQFEVLQAERLDSIIQHAWSLGIRLKFTLEHFRTIGPDVQVERFPGAANFSRPLYHVRQGGPFDDMDGFLNSEAGKQHYLQKLDWLAARYSNHPCIFGWELWNEMNAVRGKGWQQWTKEMLPELKKRCPNHLAMQNLGSFDGDWAQPVYDEISPLADNEVAQIHRYLDFGSDWKICHGPIDAMMADAIATLRRIAPGKPALISECGAVEPNHARPWDQYPKDTDGTILHDILFGAFFAGSAGSGNCWHWHEYVDRNNLWWQFKRFSRAIEGVNPIQEELAPCRNDTGRLRVHVLQGKNISLAWCRDAASDWQTELIRGEAPTEVCGEKIELPMFADFPDSKLSVAFYDPWTDCLTEPVPTSSGVISLPPFHRSLVVRLTRH